MAEPLEQAEPLAQNPTETANAEKVRGRPFEPGNRANPGGRPKGLAKQIRERYGDALVGFAGAVLSGYVPFDAPPNEKGERTREWRECSVAERISIYRDLMDRGYGKAPQFAPIEDDDPLDLGVTGGQLADALFAELDELGKRRRQREVEAAAAAGE